MNVGRFGVSDDHCALHDAARGWCERHIPRAVPRSWLDDGSRAVPPVAETGWLSLPVDFGLSELGVVLEELGRACAPGPFLPSVTVIAALHALDGPDDVIASLAAGDAWAALAWDLAPLAVATGGRVSGRVDAIPAAAGVARVDALDRRDAPDPRVELEASDAIGALGKLDPRDACGALGEADSERRAGSDRARAAAASGSDADVATRWFLLPVEGGRWALVDGDSDTVTVTPRSSTDETRPVADGVLSAAPVLALLDDPTGLVASIARRLWSAEAVGVAAWCVETAAAYACIREQFGQPIGRFQAVKHRCADMLCTLELARAAAWDALRVDDAADPAARSLATAVAAALAPAAAVTAAKDCIQVLGGVGFTWGHDAHLYLKRALATRALVGAGARWHAEATRLVAGGARRPLAVELPADDPARTTVRRFTEELATHPKSDWRAHLADGGWIAPHWPAPWGRDATPLEQLLIDEELRGAHVRRPHLQVGAWVLPTLIAHGTPEQQERWIGPTLRGELSWCQLFSEPGAGSDLASLGTKASRADGGWLLTGQKVWTSMAAEADLGLCLARTDPSLPKREGITCFVVDMRSDGIEIRPLREITGQALFNEVFLADVFVPDDAVVGAAGSGWVAARTTLANERVSMGSGSSFGLGLELVVGLLGDLDADAVDAVAVDDVGALLVEAQALAALGLRLTLRALEGATGAQPGPEASVRKLLGVEHEQRVQEIGLGLLGRAAVAADGDTSAWLYGFLANRCLSIAGGTSEIQRNVIAERLLGLPRDAE